MSGGEHNIPRPPRKFKGYYIPMTWAEAERWIASYNTWVEVWNRHETYRTLPIGPEWAEGRTVANLGVYPQSCLAFIDRATDRRCLMRFRKFRPYHPGWSTLRNPADIDNLVWAGWQESAAVLREQWIARHRAREEDAE